VNTKGFSVLTSLQISSALTAMTAYGITQKDLMPIRFNQVHLNA